MTKPLLTRLQLKNYRCFEEINIDFHERLTVLVATNGGGKTSILDAIAVAFGPFVGAFDEAYGKGFTPGDIRLTRVRATSSNEMEYAAGGCCLKADGYIPGVFAAKDKRQHYWEVFSARPTEGNDHLTQYELTECPCTWERSLATSQKAKTTIKNAKTLVIAAKSLQEYVRTLGQNTLLPVVSHYGTGRLWQMKKLTSGKLQRTSRTIGYTDCLDPASSYKAFAEWFRYWTQSALEAKFTALQKNQLPESTEFDHYIASVSSAVDRCLAPAGWKNIQYSMARQELVAYHDEYGELPVSQLSDGVRNMIGLVADIAFRATKLNPQFGAEATRNTPGLVLIDEVDMHLHPAWQQVVIEGLLSAFSEVQFVVTTHSPQVITSVPAENIRILHNNRVYPAPSGTEGGESSRILKRVFGVDPRPQGNQATKDLNEYLKLVYADQWDSPRARELRLELDARYQGEEPALTEADLHIENRVWEKSLEGDAEV